MSRDALVVGISTYEYSRLGKLNATSLDAEAVAQKLESSPSPFRVTRLPGVKDKQRDAIKVGKTTEVTLKELKVALINLFKPKGESHADTALFYFSGHGLYDESMQKGYLAASDVNPDQEKWGYSLSDLRELVQSSPVRRQIIWLDCCHSGSLLAINEANPGEKAGYSRCFIAGAREFELAYELTSGEHGVLTEALLQGLNPDRLPGQWISTLSLSAYIDSYVKNKRQTYPQQCIFLNVGEPIDLTRGESTSIPEVGKIALQADICPYMALEAFDFNEHGAKFFFGRTALTDELLSKIYNDNFLIVLGASGSGKSSVVRAGLLHEIKKGTRRSGTDAWEILPVIKPGESPLYSLASAFIPEEIRSKKSGESLAKTHIRDLTERGSEALVELVEDYEKTVVLVIDQFEEVFTLCKGSVEKEQERIKFFACLFGALDKLGGKLRIVATMRADFLGKCLEQPYSGIAERIKACRVDITPMNETELEEAIAKPAELVGLRVTPKLVERMKLAVGNSPGSLPLLQYALTELWKDWHESYQADNSISNELTLDGYHRIDGVEGALEKQANQVYEDFANLPIKQGLVQRIFLELVQPGEDTEDVRRRIRKSGLLSYIHSEVLVDEVLNKLVEARLVVTDELKLEDDNQPEAIIDLAHEATIRYWKLLRQWLDEHRKALPLIRQLREEAKKWQTQGIENAKHFLRGVRLDEAVECLEKYGDLGYFDEDSREFIHLSKETWIAEETEKEQQILEGLYMSAELLWKENKQLESLIAIVRAGKHLQEKKFTTDNEMLVRVKLCETIYHRICEKNRLQSHRTKVNSVAFSLDGQTIASASNDETIKLWNFQGKELLTLTGHTESVNSVAFSPDRQTIASASWDKTIKLWNFQGKELLTLTGHTTLLDSVVFSPDGQIIASSGWDSMAKLWNLQGEEILTFSGHKHSRVDSVVFAPDGQTIASASWDKTVKLWNLQGEEILTFSGHNNLVNSVAFAPDGQTIASASNDKTVKLWNLQGTELLTFSGHSDCVYSVVFAPDGQTVASASRDKTVKLWNLKGTELLTLEHRNEVDSVAFAPDGQIIASASNDDTVKVWNIQERMPFAVHSNWITSIVFTPDGQTIASATRDKTVKLWNLKGKELLTFIGHSNMVNSVAFSPDGQTMASASADKTVKLWNLQGKELFTLIGHSNVVNSAIFSTDGQTLLSSSYDSTMKLWNLQGEELLTFSGHSASVTGIAFAPDGQIIASSSHDRTVKLWNLRGKELLTFAGHSDWVESIAFAPDGQTIASASSDRTVKLWNLQGKELLTFAGHSNSVNSVVFAPDGQTIASASRDRTVKLWNLQGKELFTFAGHSDSVNSVVFAPDGQTIASSGWDNTIRLIRWEFDLDVLVNQGCAWLHDYLTYNPTVSASDKKLCDC